MQLRLLRHTLPTNHKGHYFLDVAHFLTQGKTNQGQSVHVNLEIDDVSEPLLVEGQTIELLTVHGPWHGSPRDLQLFHLPSSGPSQLFHDFCERRSSLQLQMGTCPSRRNSTSASSSELSHVPKEQEVRDQARSQEGPESSSGSRSAGPQKQSRDVAVFQRASALQGDEQSLGSMAKLRSVRFASDLCPEGRIPGELCAVHQPRQHAEGSQATPRDLAHEHGAQRGVGSRHDGEGHCRGAHERLAEGIREGLGEEQGEDPIREGQGQRLPQRQGEGKGPSKGFLHFCQSKLSKQLDTSSGLQGGHFGTRSQHADRGRETPDPESRAETQLEQATANPGERRGAGTRLQCSVDEDYKKKLPLRVGHHMMNLLLMLNNQLNQDLASVVYGKSPVVWEMFCSPESQLTEQVNREGLQGHRINLANGFDLYKEKTYTDLQRLWQAQLPKKCWVSTPCTHYCDWSELNYKDRWEELLRKRSREKAMHQKLMSFLLTNLQKHPETELYWEWPRRCRAWKEPHMLAFQEQLRELLGREVYFCKLDGCRYGLKSSQGHHLQKSWLILTTDQIYYNQFRLQVCLKNHEHDHVQGIETSKSAYYPVAMCKAIARSWRKQLIPERWLNYLWTAPIIKDTFKEIYVGDADAPILAGDELEVPEDGDPGEPQAEGAVPPGHPSDEDRERWKVQLVRFHRAAGHPTSRNMARMLADAQLPRWKIQECLSYKCPVCEEVKPGGISSKQISPASVHELPEPWEHLGIDVAEWEVPGVNLKIKFVLLMDMATRYKVTEVLFETKHGEIKVENADDMVKVVTLRWLLDKPRPKWVIPDNAKSLTAKRFEEYMGDLGIAVGFPPAHESWAHGLVERGIQQVKETANAIHISMPDQPPALTLALATAAVNSTEYVKGFSSLQWTFGRQAEITDEELRQQLALPVDRQQDTFLKLMNQRQLAEECARKARAQTVLSKLRNTSVRQPLRTYGPAELVMVWRKFLPLEFHTGKRGGVKRTVKARWIGPGRVVLHELVPGHRDEDRKSIVWVTVGSQLFRCSVHSVRPLSEREHAVHEATNQEQVLWRQLSDMLPRREFVDIEHEEPQESEHEEPHLPEQPPRFSAVRRPVVRFKEKSPVDEKGRPTASVNDYDKPSSSSNERSSASAPGMNFELPSGEPVDELGNDVSTPIRLPSRRSSITSTTPLNDHDENDNVEPDTKRTRYDNDDDDLDDYLEMKHQQIMEEVDAGYFMNIEIILDSNRQRKKFLESPHLYLAKKMSGAEVQFRKLSDEDRKLFKNAKNSEVSSFLRTEAVRRCLSWEEEQEARRSGRVLKSRWVLVWKGVPEESREEAIKDHHSNSNTTYNKSGTKKAKARIVVLGYQHPDLLSPSLSTTAPVQCQLTRNLSFCVAAQRGWQLESLDMSTAFLQTGKTEESRRIWMHGVDELNEALGASPQEVLRILKNVYGNATAPRGLWEDVDKTLKALGARRLIGDASFWIFTAPNPKPRNECDVEILLGYIGGHVDDFQRSGDLSDPRWLKIRGEIDRAYKWGSTKVNRFRYTGLDITVKDVGNEHLLRWT